MEITEAFVRSVRAGLSSTGQKELPCSYLYDEIGTALFEAITLLPEYGVSRAETRLLCRYRNKIAGMLPPIGAVVELGSGNGSKTRFLLDALADHAPLRYYPIDVSARALAGCIHELGDLPGVEVHPLNLTYFEGLTRVLSEHSKTKATLVLFLGSTIGNFHRDEAAAFLEKVRGTVERDDVLLFGVDLDKPVPQLIEAYDDPTGVTAAFNLNLLGHINRELGADFQLRNFVHEVRFNEAERRIEMHLRSIKDQVITIPAADLRIEIRKDETIWTEASYRYNPAELDRLVRDAGFEQRGIWIDEEWPFASVLCRAQ